MSARPRSFTGPVHGRTHRSAPTRWGRRSGTNGNRRDTTPFLVKGGAGWCVRRRGVVTPPYGCATGDAKQRADVGIGPYASRGDEGRHAGSSCPTGGCGEPPRLPWVAVRSEASAPVPGKVQEGAGAPSWFPPPAERIGIIFPGDMCGGKIPDSAALGGYTSDRCHWWGEFKGGTASPL